MALIDDVKKRLKIYYYEEEKENEIQSYIDEAISYLKAAGAKEEHFTEGSETGVAIGAVSLYVKMAMEADPKEMKHNPVLLSMISQLKYTTPEAV